MIGAIGDFFRFWWGLVYWNARKSVFRLRHGRGRCPCQNPSDSGRALETGCDAAQDWRRPARFQRVCPLLVETPDGLRCSVAAADVRPFWRRALAYYGGAAAALYLAGTLGAFALLSVIGYPLSPLTLLWPPRWHDLRLARSLYFVDKAQRALNADHVNEAILSLEIAYRNNPGNYAVGLQLAQLMSVGQPDFADHLFARLMHDHPAQQVVTAEAWLRLLLEHGRFASVAQLAAERFVSDPAQRPAWLHALFFATRHSGNIEPLRDLVDRHASQLEPIYVALINSELTIRAGNGQRLLTGLTTELPEAAGSYAPYYQISRLVSLGHPTEALNMLNRYASIRRLPAADIFRLRLDILAALGRPDVLRARLEQGGVNARELELICTNLVRYPNPDLLAPLVQSLQRSHLPANADTYSAYAAFYAACGVLHDWDKLRLAARLLKETSGSRMMQLGAIESFFKQENDGAKIENILPLLPGLSLDMIYALYDHYAMPPSALAVKVAPPS